MNANLGRRRRDVEGEAGGRDLSSQPVDDPLQPKYDPRLDRVGTADAGSRPLHVGGEFTDLRPAFHGHDVVGYGAEATAGSYLNSRVPAQSLDLP